MVSRLILRFRCLACKGVYAEAQPDGTIYMHACGPLRADKNNVQLEPEAGRDETLAYNRAGRLMGISNEGQGVICLDDKNVKEPIWITKLNERIAKAEDDSNG
jgi:hypothetical protein